MGLNVNSQKAVTYDHTHERFADTSVQNNPTKSLLHDITIYHIYRRKKDSDRSGDGNPLIYAFKKMNGYSIPPLSKTMLLNRVHDIVANFQAEIKADYIMALPSSNMFCSEFAGKISYCLNIPLLDNSFLLKRTVSSMLNEYDGNVPKNINKHAQRAFKDTLADWKIAPSGGIFSMKDLPPKIRHCFNPIELAPDSALIDGTVLLVDDLFSTGSSIMNTANLMRSLGANVHQAITFISGLEIGKIH